MAKVLIAEDDPLMIRIYEKIFSFEKFEVELAHDGEEALEKARTTNPSIIMLDVMMPKMNGIEALERLKDTPATKNIPVVMLTNVVGEQEAEVAASKGALKYLIKSEHDPKEVVEIIKSILAGHSSSTVPLAA